MLLLGAVLVLPVGPRAAAQETSPATDRPDVELGLDNYQRYCQSCHGKWGRGDGRVAKWLKVPPADLTQLSERYDGQFPADKLAQVIDGRALVRTHGNREMPIWGRLLVKEAGGDDPEAAVRDRIAELVEVLRWFDEEAPGAGETADEDRR